MPRKRHTKLGMISIIESWVDSNQDSESFLSREFDLNQNSGSFLNRESIWIQFQKSVLGRELIWIHSCKTVVSHKLSRIKTFWGRVESNNKMKIPKHALLIFSKIHLTNHNNFLTLFVAQYFPWYFPASSAPTPQLNHGDQTLLWILPQPRGAALRYLPNVCGSEMINLGSCRLAGWCALGMAARHLAKLYRTSFCDGDGKLFVVVGNVTRWLKRDSNWWRTHFRNHGFRVSALRSFVLETAAFQIYRSETEPKCHLSHAPNDRKRHSWFLMFPISRSLRRFFSACVADDAARLNSFLTASRGAEPAPGKIRVSPPGGCD